MDLELVYAFLIHNHKYGIDNHIYIMMAFMINSISYCVHRDFLGRMDKVSLHRLVLQLQIHLHLHAQVAVQCI